MLAKSGAMAPESPSSSWDERQHRHKKYRVRSPAPELNLNQSLNHHEQFEEGDRLDSLGSRPPRGGADNSQDNHHERQQFMAADGYDDGLRHSRQSSKRQSNNRGDHESSGRVVTGLDLNVGHGSPEVQAPLGSSGKKLPRSPNSRPSLPSPPPLPVPSSRKDRSLSRSPGQSRKSPPQSFSNRRRSSHRKQSSPAPGGRLSPHSPRQQLTASSPPSKRARLPARQRSSPPVEERQQRQEQQRQYSPLPEPGPARRRSPYAAEERRLPARKRSPPPIVEERRPPPQEEQQRQFSLSPVRRRDPSPEPPREERRLQAGKRSPNVEERQEQEQQRQYSPSPVRRRDSSPEPAPAARRRSPYADDERRRSVTPLRRPSPSAPEVSPPVKVERGQRRSVTPLRRRPPSVEGGGAGAKRRYPSNSGDRVPRSVTPLRKKGAASPDPGRKPSPTFSGERKRHALDDGPRKRERSRTPIYHRNQSLSRSPMPRRSPSPGPPSRRTRSPVLRRRSRSPRRSPAHRDRSPRRRGSPRRGSSPSRYRGSSRRDRHGSPGGRRGWSPVQNRSNGVGKPGNNLFIAGFNFITTERDLERKFSRYGRVMDVRIVRDKRSGESRGFGFLTLERDEDADAAIKALDQTEWNGRIVLVEKAKTPTRF